MKLRHQIFDIDALYTALETLADEQGLTQLAAALPFARDAHSGQLRKGTVPVPYIIHPLMMVSHAVSLGLTDDTLLAALMLHDVCEDCGVPPETLPVSERARDAVRLVTYPAGSVKEDIDPVYYAAILRDPIAGMVKVIDRINNLSGMALAFTPARMRFYLNETETYTLSVLNTLETEKLYPATALFALRYQLVSLMNTAGALVKDL